MVKIRTLGLLIAGFFLICSAIIPIIGWGGFIALNMFYPTESSKATLPDVAHLITLTLLYSTELSLGVIALRKALK